jgi:hypothetical protein
MARKLTLSWEKLREPDHTHLDTTDDIVAGATLKKDHPELRRVSK